MFSLIFKSLIISFVLTGLSYTTALLVGWTTELNWIEIASVFTSYSCTYLCVVQSRFNYIIGTISVILLSYLFYTQSLFGSMTLNIYLIPMLLYGWFRWGKDEYTRKVTSVLEDSWPWLVGYIGITIGTYTILLGVMIHFNTILPFVDTAILVLSILAQFLLDNKKQETWIIWAIVNVMCIVVYFNAGLYLLSFQFVMFLANTFLGWYKWQPQKS